MSPDLSLPPRDFLGGGGGGGVGRGGLPPAVLCLCVALAALLSQSLPSSCFADRLGLVLAFPEVLGLFSTCGLAGFSAMMGGVCGFSAIAGGLLLAWMAELASFSGLSGFCGGGPCGLSGGGPRGRSIHGLPGLMTDLSGPPV